MNPTTPDLLRLCQNAGQKTRNVLFRRTIEGNGSLLLAALLSVMATTARAAESGHALPDMKEGAPACCATESTTAKPGECCKTEVASAPFTARSLYQIDAAFTTDAGQAFTLGELRGRPVVLTMFFASCGYACPLLVTDMQAIRGKLPADVRERAAFVLVSFDTIRDTPAALANYRAERGLDASWILLHGSADSVRELAALLGVKYKQEADGAFSHSNLITILNPQGEIAHQCTGLKGGLAAAAVALATATVSATH